MSKKLQWYLFAVHENELNFNSNGIAIIEAGGKKRCIVQFKNTMYAVAYTCPHASGIMANGYVDGSGNIVCPVHRYKFNVVTGHNTSGDGYFLKTYPIEERRDGWYIGIEKTGLFGF